MDGHTRIPVYLKASNNNSSDTVPELFLQAVEEYGLPSRVRSDKGGENVGVPMSCCNIQIGGQEEEA